MPKKHSVVLYIILGLFLIIVVYVLVVLSRGNTNLFGRAASSGVFNSTNSYVFASPLTGRVGGDKIRVTVFALDDQGKGVANKNVLINCREESLCQSGQVSFSPAQPTTDSLGQAIYDVSAVQPGKYEIQAQVDGIIIPQTVTIIFQ